MKAIRLGLLVGLIVTLASACASAGAAPPPSATRYNTLMAGWEHHFKIDSTGNVVGQRIGYVPGGVGGFGRAYFVVSNLPVADNYRVSVWDYTWFQAPKDLR